MYKENDIIYQRYRLLESFGRGGFSIVWKARDEKTDMIVALKVFMKQDRDGIELCRQEFRKAHDLIHPYIVRPMFFDEYQGAPFLVMPFYEKGTAIQQVGEAGERDIARLMQQIGAALDYLHTRTNSILHNDIKPDNFLISNEGEYHLSDFGISDQLQMKLTQTIGGYFALEPGNQKAGMTPIAYRAPELFPLKNYPKQEPSSASDIWAFGASLYQMAKGEAPFSGQGGLTQRIGMTSGSYLANLLEELPPHISPVLQGWITACLALEPRERPTARQLQQAGEHFLQTGFWPAPPAKTTTAYSTPAEIPATSAAQSTAPAWQPPVYAPGGLAYHAPPPPRRMMVPVWIWALAALLLCTGAFAIFKTNQNKTCTGLLAEADRYFSMQDYEKAKLAYLDARACDPFVADDLTERIRRSEVLGKIASYPASLPASEGLVAVGDTILERMRWGFLDSANGALKIALRYDSVQPFFDGKATVWKNGVPAFIDTNGKDLQDANFTKKGQDFLADANHTAANDPEVPAPATAQYRPVGKVDFSISETTVYTGTPIQFTDQSSPLGNVARRVWDFGDQNKATSQKASTSHSYSSPGTYQVRLCVNEGNQCSGRKTITVIADRPNLEREGSAGYDESLRSRCLAEKGDPIWKSGECRISLKPKSVLELQSAVLFGDVGGKVKITLSGGKGSSASVTRYVNRGRSSINLDDLGITLEPGKSYSLSIVPLADGSGKAPRLENAAACANSDGSSGQLGIAYGGDGVLFSLRYAY
ncbi:MAG: protein kinase [Lewinellaceae bacterium]|nr:protein kinase [Saprospiraceae bacterium]MCB9338308.1 protein kinase [Lewinellaceae bacterium]